MKKINMCKITLAVMLVLTILILSGKYEIIKAAGNKVNIYVVTKYGDTSYTYNDKGLLSKESSYGGSVISKYKYDTEGNMKSFEYKEDMGGYTSIRSCTAKLSYDKSGRLTKIVSNGSHSSNTYIARYYYNEDNQINKEVREGSSYVGGKVLVEYEYNAKGQLIKETYDNGDSFSYKYDKNGNLSFDGNTTYKNTYSKKGHLIKRERVEYNDSSSLKYKKIEVDKKIANKIRKQQWEIINEWTIGLPSVV